MIKLQLYIYETILWVTFFVNNLNHAIVVPDKFFASSVENAAFNPLEDNYKQCTVACVATLILILCKCRFIRPTLRALVEA